MSKTIEALTGYLAQGAGATDTTLYVRGLKDSRGRLITSMPSGVTLVNATIEPLSVVNREAISFTGITDQGGGVVALTGVTRNLDPLPPHAAMTADVPHGNNVPIIISNGGQFYNKFLKTDEDAVVTASIQFPTPTLAAHPATKAYADALVTAGAPDASTSTKGIGKISATPMTSLGACTITVASPAVISTAGSHGLIAGDTVQFTTTGALPTGLSVGNVYYVIAAGLTATQFQLSTTLAGAAVNTTGTQSGVHTVYKTTPTFVGNDDTRLPTQAENDAMAGVSGTNPSSANPFVDAALLTGTIVAWGGASAPTGWLLCDGTAVSRTTYANLFAILSTTYGTGDGSTTFNLPNLKGKVIVGKDVAQTEFDTLGEAGGEKTHVLTESEMPSHSHNTFNGTTGVPQYANTYYYIQKNSGVDTAQAYGNGIGMQDAGSDAAHNNLQPYLVLNHIIKH